MSHQFIEGKIFHKRFYPKKHQFSYGFYFLDINLDDFESLEKCNYFSINKFNLFSFYSKDHFGSNNSFIKNVKDLFNKFNINEEGAKLRFLALPRICNFVFNPISLVLVIKNKKPIHMLAEVFNYNGGNTVYDLPLKKTQKEYFAITKKDMSVSPFFSGGGIYKFYLIYGRDLVTLKIDYYEKNRKSLTAIFSGKSIPFNSQNILKLFFRYWFLTFFVVTRTFFQAWKLYKKGLKWYKFSNQDKTRRY